MTSEKWEAGGKREDSLPTSASELGRRLDAIISLYRTKKDAADMAGVSPDQLSRYVKGQNAAPFEVLARLASPKGVRLDWLATGEGPMLASEALAPAASSAAVDPVLYGRVLEAVSGAYKEAGFGVALRQIGAEAAEIAADLSTLPAADRDAALQGAILMLRRRLRQAVADPTGDAAGKRQA